MLINNKMKMFLCGESYWSNSNRKQLPVRLDNLRDEYKNTIWKKKKRKRTTYDIGEDIEINIYRLWRSNSNQVKELKDKLYWLTDNKKYRWHQPIINVRIVEKWSNKSGREEYNAEIIWVRDENEVVNESSVVWHVVKIQSI